MKITKKLTVILLTLIIAITMLSIMPNCVFASDNYDLGAFEDDNVKGTEKAKNLVNSTAQTAIAVARVVCVSIAIVILLVISMKYMMSAPGDRADIKKHAVHYVIGAFILFGVTGILGVINNFALQIK